MSDSSKTCYIPFELWSDNADSISFFLRIGQADMAVLLIVRYFYAIEEWQQLLWDNRTAGSETVKCCYGILPFGILSEHPSEMFRTVQLYFKILADLGGVRHASLCLK